MNTMKHICKLLDIMCVEVIQGDLHYLLVNGKVFFEDYILKDPLWRDMVHRAFLIQCGLDVDKNYQAMYDDLKGSVK